MKYQAFLLRIWCDRDADEETWRIVLQPVDTGKATALHSLEELLHKLKQSMDDDAIKGV